MCLPMSSVPSTTLPVCVFIADAAFWEKPDAEDVPDAVNARWMIVPSDSPSTNDICKRS